MIAVYLMAFAYPVAASETMTLPIGRDPAVDPPMDNPAIPWFNYWTDDLGRKTFLPADCLFSTDKNHVKTCVQQAILDHRLFVEKHDRDAILEAQREEFRQKLAREENERKAAEQKRLQEAENARLAEQARERAIEDRNARIAANRAAHDPKPYASEIRALKAELVRYRRMMNREDRVGEVSGYVDAGAKHGLGEAIVTTEERIASAYEEYRAHGGRLPLSSL